MLCVACFPIIIISGYVVASGKDGNIVEQIYHGEPGNRSQFPFLVRLYVRTVQVYIMPLCAGTIVKDDTILTAGHCCTESGQKYAVYGEADQERFYREVLKTNNLNVSGYYTYRVQREIIHPEFRPTKFTVEHDVCLLFLEKPMNTTIDQHAVATLSYLGLPAQLCTAVGWGQTENNKMQFKLYQKDVYAEQTWRGNWVLRLYSHVICSGDSGGPLLCKGKVYGVASYSTTYVCSRPGLDYYAYLHEEKDFLKLHINRGSMSHNKMYCLLLIILLKFLKN